MLDEYKCINNRFLKSLSLKPWFLNIMKIFKFYCSCSSAARLIYDMLEDSLIVNTIKLDQSGIGKVFGHFVVYKSGYIYDAHNKIEIGELCIDKVINFKFGTYKIVDYKNNWEDFKINNIPDLVNNVKKYLNK